MRFVLIFSELKEPLLYNEKIKVEFRCCDNKNKNKGESVPFKAIFTPLRSLRLLIF